MARGRTQGLTRNSTHAPIHPSAVKTTRRATAATAVSKTKTKTKTKTAAAAAAATAAKTNGTATATATSTPTATSFRLPALPRCSITAAPESSSSEDDEGDESNYDKGQGHTNDDEGKGKQSRARRSHESQRTSSLAHRHKRQKVTPSSQSAIAGSSLASESQASAGFRKVAYGSSAGRLSASRTKSGGFKKPASMKPLAAASPEVSFPTKPKFKAPPILKGDHDEDSPTQVQPLFRLPPTLAGLQRTAEAPFKNGSPSSMPANGNRGNKGRVRKPATRSTPLTQAPEFPAVSSIRSTISERSSAGPNSADGVEGEVKSRISAESPVESLKCSICGEEIAVKDRDDFLDLLFPRSAVEKRFGSSRSHHRLTVRQQAKLCRYHREVSAKAEWIRRGYPHIDWSGLPERLRGLDAAIKRLINRAARDSSHLARATQIQKDTSNRRKKFVVRRAEQSPAEQLQTTLEETTSSLGAECVGYYGGRGARQVGEYLAEVHSQSLRNAVGPAAQAIADSGGLVCFVQLVLVPEVISRLIAQDMDCELDTASVIMTESAELGKLLCEDEDDAISDDEGNEYDSDTHDK